MLTKIATKITNRLLLHNIIHKEMMDVYIYGFELFISFLFSTSIIFILGLVFNVFLQTLSFFIVFVTLRGFSGGFHSKTYCMCTIVTLTVYSLVMILSQFVSVSFFSYIFLLLVGVSLLGVFAPIENPNKKLNLIQKRRNKILSIVLFILFISTGVLLRKVNMHISSSIFFSLISDLLLLFIKNHRKERKENEVF